jgi:hypothetical protein
MRVSCKDLENNSQEFLLWMKELKDDDHWTKSLFENKECECCKKIFKPIEKYQWNSPDGSTTFCSQECDNKYQAEQQEKCNIWWDEHSAENNSIPVIYKITNKNNNKCYIGQTRQVVTLRWYQHFYQSTDNLFHNEIKATKLSDWTFEIIEIIEFPNEIKNDKDLKNKYITERERYYIIKYSSIENGYNSKI